MHMEMLLHLMLITALCGKRGWTGGGDKGAGIRDKGAGDRDKGAGDGIKGRGGGRGDGGTEIWGWVLYQNLLYFIDFTPFLCTSMQ